MVMETKGGKGVALILQRYPDRVPLILTPDPKIPLEHSRPGKYLVPRSCTCVYFIQMIRRLLNIPSTHALFFLTSPQNRLLCGNTEIGKIYDREASADQFLYVVYAFENAFGLRDARRSE